MMMLKGNITKDTLTVIELTQGKHVLVQGVIGVMAATKEWDYNNRNQIRRNIVDKNGKRQKQSLIRFLLSLEIGDGIRASQVSKKTVMHQGHECLNYQTSNLKTNRKGYALHAEIHKQMKAMGF